MRFSVRNSPAIRTALAAALLAVNACAVAEQTTTAAENSASPAPLASAADYTRVCGICHLEDGAGVPGAFPPLDQRLAAHAASDAGRDFLSGILKNGLYGQINVNGTTYNGAMPPLSFQLDAEQMAGMLNYVLATFAASDATFTAAEITRRQDKVGSTAGATLRKAALANTSE